MNASLAHSAVTAQPKDFVFSGLLLILFFTSLLFPNFFAYSPLILGLAGGAFYRNAIFKIAPQLKSLAFAFAILAGMAFLSSLWSAWAGEIIPRAAKITAIMAGSFLLCCTMRAKNEILRQVTMIRALIFTWIIAALIIVIDQYFNYPFYRLVESIPPEDIILGFEINRNIYALLITGWLLLYASFKEDQSTAKITMALRSAIIILIPLFLLKTSNQAAQLSFILSLCAFAVFPYKWPPIWPIIKTVLVLCILAAPLIAITSYEIFAAHYSDAQSTALLHEAAIPQRLEIWSFLSHHILDKPLLGYGMEATRYTIFDSPQIFWSSQTVLHPHNFALQLWIEWGLIGALIGAVFCVLAVTYIQKRIYCRTDILILASFLAWLCTASFSYGLWQSQFLGLNLFMIALAILFLPPLEKFETEKPETKKRESEKHAAQ